MRRLGFVEPINWVFTPSAGVVAGALGEDMVVYYCVDEFTAFTGLPPQMVQLEDELCRRADLVIVSAQAALRQQVQQEPAHRARPPRRRLRPLPEGPRPRDRGPGRDRATCPARSSATSG